jgi:hypothetical protein
MLGGKTTTLSLPYAVFLHGEPNMLVLPFPISPYFILFYQNKPLLNFYLVRLSFYEMPRPPLPPPEKLFILKTQVPVNHMKPGSRGTPPLSLPSSDSQKAMGCWAVEHFSDLLSPANSALTHLPSDRQIECSSRNNTVKMTPTYSRELGVDISSFLGSCSHKGKMRDFCIRHVLLSVRESWNPLMDYLELSEEHVRNRNVL